MGGEKGMYLISLSSDDWDDEALPGQKEGKRIEAEGRECSVHK